MVYIQLGRETILEIDMMFFSIIIPLYNKVGQIRTTLESVLSQSLRDFELIVVNDGSTDGSDSIVSSIHDSRVRLINKNNGGVSSARNVGVKNANGDWIILLDADDIMLPDALLNMSKMIQKHPHDLYFSGRTKWKGEVGRKITNRIKKTYWPFFHIWTRTIDPAPRCVVLHRSLFDRYGNYDERMSFYEDWELSLRLACCGSIVYTDTYFALYTPNDKGLGSKNGARGVGLATTDTVVIASIGILALNFCLTMVLNKLFALL